MPTYISNSGEAKDTADMNEFYLARALAKAKAEGNEANIKVLEEELASRQ